MPDAVVCQAAGGLELAAGGEKAVATGGHAFRLLDHPPHAFDAVSGGNIQGNALRPTGSGWETPREAGHAVGFHAGAVAALWRPARNKPARAGSAQRPGRP